MNYGVLTRITTVITGIIIIIILPLALTDVELQKFFIMYAILPVVALVDFGLSARILAAQNARDLSLRPILSMIFFRCSLLVIITTGLFNYFETMNLKIILIIEIALVIYYLSIICNAVVEAFDSYEKSYKIKFISELILVVVLTLLCIDKIPYAWVFILSILVFRSLAIILYFILKIKEIFLGVIEGTQNKRRNLSKLIFQVGVVSGLGYLSGHATNWIVALNFSVDESIAYSQCFYAISAIHSVVMSYLIYYQVSFKSNDRVYDMYIRVRNEYLRILMISFVFVSIFCLCSLFIINEYIDTVKFDYTIYLLLLLYYIPIINNHLSAIVYRINGVELFYSLSILGSIAIVVTFYILGEFYDLPVVLLVNVIISIIVNIAFTNLIVMKKGYHV